MEDAYTQCLSSNPPVIKPSMSQGPKIWRVKESSIRTQKLNSKLLSLKFKTNSMMSLPAQRRTKEKGSRRIQRLNFILQRLKKRISKKSLLGQINTIIRETKEKIKSSVPIAGRASTLNMPAWRRNLMRRILSSRETIFISLRTFEGEIIKIGIPNKKEVMLSWKAPRSRQLYS